MLIELFVVIATIAILAARLLPALVSTKEHANWIQCVSQWTGKFIFPFSVFGLALVLLMPALAAAQIQPVAITVTNDACGADLAPHFLGLSYETSMVLPKDGRYYFDSHDQALINTFKTLGIKSLRVGANAVDNPNVSVPEEKDIDILFDFARAAEVKVIYSFRLKNGEPTNSARLASYITAHDADVLDCFAMGNESNFYLKTFQEFFALWKPHYDAILKAVPGAMFDGPSASPNYALALADAVFAEGHLAMASEHFYFFGFGRPDEKDPPGTRARFLSNKIHATYQRDYSRLGAMLAARGVPYRIDEMNSCADGGAKDASDTYASTLWALDCTHWWAAHHILGVNYHTGELVGRDGKFGPPNYAAFLRQSDGHGFAMRPQGYAFLAFSQGAHGRPLGVEIQTVTNFDFNAYAYQDHDDSIYLTIINKSYGNAAQTAEISLQLPKNAGSGAWQRLDLVQKDRDIASKTGIMLGAAEVDPQGIWKGRWKTIESGDSASLKIQVGAASAAILHFYPTK